MSLNFPAKQRGQAIAFVTITMVAVMLSAIFLYKSGKLTSEKMQLQNAADAVAFSVSTLEARDLNYMSYMNRAMVANEVAIGQFVGLLSWADHITSVGQFLNWYNAAFLAGPTLGASTVILGPMATGFTAVGWSLTGTLLIWPGHSRTRIKYLSRVNGYYGYAQVAYHGTTTMLIGSAIEDLVPRNAPGARLSDFGYLSLVGHSISYANNFTTTYDPWAEKNAAEHEKGFKRFAALTRASRDPFSTFRGWQANLPGTPVYFCIDITGALRSFLGGLADLLGDILPKGCIDMRIGLDRLGGSELRYTGKAVGGNFNWSAADNTAFNLDLAFVVDFPGWMEDLGAHDIKIDLPALGAPFSAGVSQYGLQVLHYPDAVPASLGGPVDKDYYGTAPNSLVPWMFISPTIKKPKKPKKPPPAGGAAAKNTAQQGAKQGAKKGAGKQLIKGLSNLVLAAFGFAGVTGNAVKFQTTADMALLLNQFGAGYSGLPRYTDTNKYQGWGFEAPYFLAALTKTMNRVNNLDPGSPDFRPNSVDLPRGQLALTDSTNAGNVIGAVAKSEVYFKRPTDSSVAYFHRVDGRTEYGNAFNPYWQARLVDTSFADRVVTMLSQQGVRWDPGLAPVAIPAAPNLRATLQ